MITNDTGDSISEQKSASPRISSTQELRDRFGVAPVSTESICNPAIYDLEKEKIFRKTWLKVATTWEIPEIGDCKVKDLPVLDTSLVITRGRDGKIRAFHNVCTHRGNKIIPETDTETYVRARANVLTCRFHGWVFSTDGTLKSVPAQDHFGELDTACARLREVACDVWQDFVFINMEPEPSQTLADYLDGLSVVFGGYPYAESTQAYRYSTVLDCNWKVALYAFSEGYHVPTIHAGSLPGFRGADHAEFKVMSPHASSTIFAGGMDTTPATSAFAAVLHGSAAHRPRPDQLPKAINPTGRPDFQFELPTIFPNLIIHLGAGCGYPGLSFFTHQFWPMAHGKTLWEGTNYFRPPATAAEKAAQIHVSALHRNAWLEDTATMEDTFKGLMSGAITEMQLMDQEFLIRHISQNIDKYINA
ncbi:aromatic ring-hydroxylating dioxygenase subunit alpha [Novosphingobium sp. Fuku2-ISO-50]|uniref:aromatic ring-hydroxylating oxygenase subunit alpha n=1 Tax=Novosphingobium sp. Fuku2-ISO-50 TaxID=1739114 RepID=UPI0009E70FB2|nr:SRPBCC family protein [Novosphingobium sp. Fuku2-ISO-50]